MKENKPLFDLTDFFSQRKAVSSALNYEIRSLRAKCKKEEKTTILFSLSLRDTIVHLGKDIQKVLKHQNHEYPESGLSLIKIEIVNISAVNNENELSFNNYLQLRFNISDKYWNGSVPFLNTFFFDKGLKVVDNSMGTCYEPRFQSKEKYIEVKKFVLSAKKQLREFI